MLELSCPLLNGINLSLIYAISLILSNRIFRGLSIFCFKNFTWSSVKKSVCAAGYSLLDTYHIQFHSSFVIRNEMSQTFVLSRISLSFLFQNNAEYCTFSLQNIFAVLTVSVDVSNPCLVKRAHLLYNTFFNLIEISEFLIIVQFIKSNIAQSSRLVSGNFGYLFSVSKCIKCLRYKYSLIISMCRLLIFIFLLFKFITFVLLMILEESDASTYLDASLCQKNIFYMSQLIRTTSSTKGK